MTMSPPQLHHLDHIRIVMVNTTLPANIGSALRAMKTMGLSHLTLVAPKYFPHPDIEALSAGAADLVQSIRVVDCVEQAIEECHLVIATSARSRTLPWPQLDARQAAQYIIAQCVTNSAQAVSFSPLQVAILFGREDRGLTNDELALAQFHLSIPVNQKYGVLNVAQAIQVICYELRMACLDSTTAAQPPIQQAQYWDEPLVTQQQMHQFYQRFEHLLAELGLFDRSQPRLLPLRLRRLFGRIQLDTVEYNLLQSLVSHIQRLLEERGQFRQNQDQSQARHPVQDQSLDQ